MRYALRPCLGRNSWRLADIIGAVLFPIGVYFPGFTISSMLEGAVWGSFSTKRKKAGGVWRLPLASTAWHRAVPFDILADHTDGGLFCWAADCQGDTDHHNDSRSIYRPLSDQTQNIEIKIILTLPGAMTMPVQPRLHGCGRQGRHAGRLVFLPHVS